jgi:hypothetical protein
MFRLLNRWSRMAVRVLPVRDMKYRLPWRPSIFPIASLLLFCLLYALIYFQLSSRWWFEDDPFLFSYADKIHNPTKIFTDPAILRNFTTGKALVPMQLLSYWIDVRLAGFSPHFAYAHQVFSFLLTLLLLYLALLEALPEDRLAALLISILWVLLPATAVALQFLSTRHYLEGMLFCALSMYLLQRFRSAGELSGMAGLLVVLSAVVALLCKEIYAPVLSFLLMLNAWRYRDRKLAISTLTMVALYLAYRFWMLGLALDYGLPFLNTQQYLKFLTKLPYTLSTNYGGYCLWTTLAALCVYFAWRKREGYQIVLCFLAAMALSLASVIPVTYPLYGMIRRPDPWYRILFLPNTILILFGGYLAVRCTTRRTQALLATLALAILIPGQAKTRRLWMELTESAEREGKFYLDNPDKVLLSEQEAWWFIPGLQQMYATTPPHYVLINDLRDSQEARTTLLWRYLNGRFIPNYGVSQPK